MQTDMNQRERRSYAKQLRDVAEAAGKAATALESEDDATFTVQFILFGMMSGTVVNELRKILEEALEAEKAKQELERGEKP